MIYWCVIAAVSAAGRRRVKVTAASSSELSVLSLVEEVPR